MPPTDTETTETQTQDPLDEYLALRDKTAKKKSPKEDPIAAYLAAREADTKATDKRSAEVEAKAAATPAAVPVVSQKMEESPAGKGFAAAETAGQKIFGEQPTPATVAARGPSSLFQTTPPAPPPLPPETVTEPVKSMEQIGRESPFGKGTAPAELPKDVADLKASIEDSSTKIKGTQNRYPSGIPQEIYPWYKDEVANHNQMVARFNDAIKKLPPSQRAEQKQTPLSTAPLSLSQQADRVGKPMVPLTGPQKPIDLTKYPRNIFTNDLAIPEQTPEQVKAQNAAEDAQRAQDDALSRGRPVSRTGVRGLPVTKKELDDEKAGMDEITRALTTGSRKLPIPAFTGFQKGTGLPTGARVSSVGELEDLTDEYLSRPEIPKTRAQAMAAGITSDAVKTLNDMFLSPVGIVATGTGLVAANALAKAGQAGKEALELGAEYQAMKRAGATAAELLVQEGKIHQAMLSVAKAQGVLKTAARAGQVGGAAFGAQGANGVIDGIKEQDTSKILGGLGQIILAGAGEAALHRAGGLESAVGGSVEAEAHRRYQESYKPPGDDDDDEPPGGGPPPDVHAKLLEDELHRAKAEHSAKILEDAAAETRKAAGIDTEPPGEPEKPAKLKVPVRAKKPALPAPVEPVGTKEEPESSSEGEKQEKAVIHTFPGEEGTQYEVAKVDGGFSVSLRDTEAGEVFPSHRIYKTEEQAVAAAKGFGEKSTGEEAKRKAAEPEAKEPELSGEDAVTAKIYQDAIDHDNELLANEKLTWEKRERIVEHRDNYQKDLDKIQGRRVEDVGPPESKGERRAIEPEAEGRLEEAKRKRKANQIEFEKKAGQPEEEAAPIKPGDKIKMRGGMRRRSIMSGLPLTDEPRHQPEATEASAQPTPPPSDRWTADRGAMPGEPELFLDVPEDGDTEKAKAAIIQRDRKAGRATWELVHMEGGKPKSGGMFSTPQEAAARAEKLYSPPEKEEQPEHVHKEGDRVTWTGPKGEKLSGQIRSIEPHQKTGPDDLRKPLASITVDQQAVMRIPGRKGGVPIGRVEMVPLEKLSPEGAPEKAEAATESEKKPVVPFSKPRQEDERERARGIIEDFVAKWDREFKEWQESGGRGEPPPKPFQLEHPPEDIGVFQYIKTLPKHVQEYARKFYKAYRDEGVAAGQEVDPRDYGISGEEAEELDGILKQLTKPGKAAPEEEPPETEPEPEKAAEPEKKAVVPFSKPAEAEAPAKFQEGDLVRLTDEPHKAGTLTRLSLSKTTAVVKLENGNTVYVHPDRIELRGKPAEKQRYVVSKAGMKPGMWKIIDTTDGTTVRSGLESKAGAEAIAAGMKSEDQHISGATPSGAITPRVPLSTVKPQNRPHMVVREVRDRDDKLLGYEYFPYDGTPEDALAKAELVTTQMWEKYPDASNMGSRILATGKDGKPLYVMSPNLQHVAEMGTPTANYIQTGEGEPPAEMKASYEAAKKAGDEAAGKALWWRKPLPKLDADTEYKLLKLIHPKEGQVGAAELRRRYRINYGETIDQGIVAQFLKEQEGLTQTGAGAKLPTKSFAPQVIADSSGKWSGNAVSFPTEQEAQDYVNDLKSRWMAVRDTRVVEQDVPATHSFANGKLEIVKPEEADAATADQAADREGSGRDSGTAEPARVGQEPLERESSEAIQGVPEEREAAGEGEEGGAGGEVSGREPGGAGTGMVRGVGDSLEGKDVPGTRGKPGRPGISRVNPSDGPQGNFYHITESDQLGQAGLKQKFKDNVTAIKLLQKLEAENRLATTAEQAVLVKYVGWGGLSAVFKPWEDRQWTKESDELRDLLPSAEWEAASGSTQFAHYTSLEVIQGMWSALERMGFTGGRVLEDAAGVGHFMGGAPLDVAAKSKWAAVEIDPLSARITQQLYQPVKVFNSPFEKVAFPNNFFDVNITNVPFSTTSPADPKYDKYGLNLHNYFIVRGLDLLRPGGIMAVITSRGTMDSGGKHRELMADRADLLDAVRLPKTAFKGNANTEVVADVLIFRKRAPGDPKGGEAFQDSIRMKVEKDGSTHVVPERADPSDFKLNEFFLKHPEKILGQQGMTGTMRGPDQYSVEPNTATTLKEQISKNLTPPQNSYQKASASQSLRIEAVLSAERQAEIKAKPDALHIEGDKLYQNTAENLLTITSIGEILVTPRSEWVYALKPLDVSPPVFRKIKSVLGVRDAVRDVMLAEAADKPKVEVDALRKQLNKTYDKHVATYGPTGDVSNTKQLLMDPDFPLLISLESYDPKTNTYVKSADIFTKPTVRPEMTVRPENPRDAMLVSMNEKNGIDIPFMAKSIGQTEDYVINDLVGKDLIYKNPEGGWEDSASYLSGQVRWKLKAAQTAAELDPDMQRNVEALKAVQPQDKTLANPPAVKLGTPWMPVGDIEQFIRETLDLGRSVSVSHPKGVPLWTVRHPNKDTSVMNGANYGIQDESGTPILWGTDLVEHALNQKTPSVYTGKGEQRVFSLDLTERAKDKISDLQDKFKKWIWKDEERSSRLLDYYNENINNMAQRTYDGSHLTIPSMALGMTMRAHGKNAVWRIQQSANTLLAHEVGSGKTMILIASALEAKRLGKWKKPALFVHNATLEQYRMLIPQAFPTAKILVARPEDFDKENRRRLLARIATGDWDTVVIAHSQIPKLPVSEAGLRKFMGDEIEILKGYLRKIQMEEASAYHDSGGRGGKRQKSQTVKQLEATIDKAEARMEKKIHDYNADPTVSFEETGIDAILVDEADEFKNLMYHTKMTRVKGLGNTEGSSRAFDLYAKIRVVQAMNNGGGVVFATGTPVSNTMAEIYNLQRYLAQGDLEAMGIDHFDAWAAQFGETKTDWETSPSDPTKIQAVTRFARIQNAQELYNHTAPFMDVVFSKDIPGIKLPKHNQQKIVVPSYKELEDYNHEIMDRAEHVKTGQVDPKDDNMLKITSNGSAAAIDMRFVKPGSAVNPASKLYHVALDVYKNWKDSAANKGVQLICLDLGVPDTRSVSAGELKFGAYKWLREHLISMGIPGDEITWIQKYNKPEAKQQMIRDTNSGKIRVLIGSTEKMGVGLNVQERLIGGHHVDMKWRPRDAIQREGRWVRQGNSNSEVFTKYWTAEKSIDSYKYSTLAAKISFINDFLQGKITASDVEDISGEAVTFAIISAATTGKTEIFELAKTQAEIRKLERARFAAETELLGIKQQLVHGKARLKATQEEIEQAKTEVEAVKKVYDPENFQITLNGKLYTDKEEAKKALQKTVLTLKDRQTMGTQIIGSYLGVPITFDGHGAELGKDGKRSWYGYNVKTPRRSVAIEHTTTGTLFDDPIASVIHGVVRAPENDLEKDIAEKATLKQDIPKLEELLNKTDFPPEKAKKLEELQVKERGLLKALGLLDDDTQAAGAIASGKTDVTVTGAEGDKEEDDEEGAVGAPEGEPEPPDKPEVGAGNKLFTKEAKEAAEKDLSKKSREMRAGVDPTMIKDLVVIGGFYLEAGIRDFAGWADKMRAHFRKTRDPQKFEPHLQPIYEQAIKAINKQKPGFAANIRLSNLRTSDQVKELIRETARSAAGRIEGQRRGEVPFAQTKAMARELIREGHMTEKDLIDMKKGTALNDAELKAARSILVSVSEDRAKALDEFRKDDSKENLLRVMEVVERQRAVQAAVSGATAEAGRALNSMKIAAEALKSRSARDKALDELGGDITEEMIRRLAQIPPDDFIAMNKFVRDHTKFTTIEKLNSYWIANILSGWQTHARVAFSNIVWATTQLGIRPLRGLIDAPVSRLMGTERKYYAGETLPAMVGWFEGIPEGLRKAIFIMQHGYNLDDTSGEIVTDVKAPRYYEFPGGLKNPFNYPGRALMAAHNLFRVTSLESELAAIAARKAIRSGGVSPTLGQSRYQKQYARERANPEVEDVEAAQKFARYTAFLDKPDKFSQLMIRIREWRVPENYAAIGGVKPLRFVVPFINLPWNVLKAGVEVTPAGALKFLSKDARNQPGKAADIISKALFGAAVMGAAAILAMNGKLTGPAPKDPGKREEFYRLGKKPYAFRVGDRWYPYLRWSGPFGVAIAVTAAWYDKYDADGTIPSTERLTNAASAVGRATFDQSYFVGIANMLDSIREGKASTTKFLADIATGFVPFSGMQRNIVQQTDIQRIAKSIPEKVASGIPVLSKTLSPQRDIFGRTSEQGITGTASKDPVDLELERIGIHPEPLKDKITIKPIEFELSPKGEDFYTRTTGRLLYKMLAETMKSEEYTGATDFVKQKYVEREVGRVREAGRLAMLAQLKSHPEYAASPMFKIKVPFAHKAPVSAPGRQ